MISFTFNISFQAAAFLVALERFNEKHPDGDTGSNKIASDDFAKIPRTSHFITHSRQLSRQGLITHKRDKEGRVMSWQITPKGKAMIRVLECEMQEMRLTLKLYGKVSKQIG